MAQNVSLFAIGTASSSIIATYTFRNEMAHFLWPQIPQDQLPYPFETTFPSSENHKGSNTTLWGLVMFPVAAISSYYCLKFSLGLLLRSIIRRKYRIQPLHALRSTVSSASAVQSSILPTKFKYKPIGITDSLHLHAPYIVQCSAATTLAVPFAGFAKIYRDGPGTQFDAEFYRTGQETSNAFAVFDRPLPEHPYVGSPMDIIASAYRPPVEAESHYEARFGVADETNNGSDSAMIVAAARAGLGEDLDTLYDAERDWRVAINTKFDEIFDEEDERVGADFIVPRPDDIVTGQPRPGIRVYPNQLDQIGMNRETLRQIGVDDDASDEQGGSSSSDEKVRIDLLRGKLSPIIPKSQIDSPPAPGNHLDPTILQHAIHPVSTRETHSLQLRHMLAEAATEQPTSPWEKWYDTPGFIVDHVLDSTPDDFKRTDPRKKHLRDPELDKPTMPEGNPDYFTPNQLKQYRHRVLYDRDQAQAEHDRQTGKVSLPPAQRVRSARDLTDAESRAAFFNETSDIIFQDQYTDPNSSPAPGLLPVRTPRERAMFVRNKAYESAWKQGQVPETWWPYLDMPEEVEGMFDHRHEYYMGRGAAHAGQPSLVTQEPAYDPNVLPIPNGFVPYSGREAADWFTKMRKKDYDVARGVAGAFKRQYGIAFPQFKDPEPYPESMLVRYPELRDIQRYRERTTQYFNSLHDRVMYPPPEKTIVGSALSQDVFEMHQNFNPELYSTSVEYRTRWNQHFPQLRKYYDDGNIPTNDTIDRLLLEKNDEFRKFRKVQEAQRIMQDESSAFPENYYAQRWVPEVLALNPRVWAKPGRGEHQFPSEDAAARRELVPSSVLREQEEIRKKIERNNKRIDAMAGKIND